MFTRYVVFIINMCSLLYFGYQSWPITLEVGLVGMRLIRMTLASMPWS